MSTLKERVQEVIYLPLIYTDNFFLNQVMLLNERFSAFPQTFLGVIFEDYSIRTRRLQANWEGSVHVFGLLYGKT